MPSHFASNDHLFHALTCTTSLAKEGFKLGNVDYFPDLVLNVENILCESVP